MSTLSSWIDPDEISELMPILLPESREKEKEEPRVSSPARDDENAVNIAPTETPEPPTETAETDTTAEIPVPGEAGASPPEATGEKPEAAEMPPPATDTSAPEFNFNASDAYDVSPFPEKRSESAGEDGGDAARQTAAVQAAETLERVRSRANQGGLLRNAEEAAQAEVTSEPRYEVEIPDASPKPAGERTDAAPEASRSEAEETEASPNSPPPGSFRDRLSRFAASAVGLTGGADPVVTDLQSYPLYLPANGSDAGNARSIGAIVRMNQQIAGMPNQPNGGTARTSQIALSSSEWLCVLTQGSAAGQVCASLRIPEPLSSKTVETLHEQLRAAIDG